MKPEIVDHRLRSQDQQISELMHIIEELEKRMPDIESLKQHIETIKIEIGGYESVRAVIIEEDAIKKTDKWIRRLRDALATFERLMPPIDSSKLSHRQQTP